MEVEFRHLSLLEWQSGASGEETKKVRVFDDIAVRWNIVAERLGLEPGEIESIRRNKHDDRERLTSVFGRWFENANMLPNKNKYPKNWTGLIRLLCDSDFGELAEKLRNALCAPFNSVKNNIIRKR